MSASNPPSSGEVGRGRPLFSTRKRRSARRRPYRRRQMCKKGDGAPGVTRTPGTRFRKPLLYPPELRGHTSLPVAEAEDTRPSVSESGPPATAPATVCSLIDQVCRSPAPFSAAFWSPSGRAAVHPRRDLCCRGAPPARGPAFAGGWRVRTDAPAAGAFGAVALGFLFGPVSLPCTGPVLLLLIGLAPKGRCRTGGRTPFLVWAWSLHADRRRRDLGGCRCDPRRRPVAPWRCAPPPAGSGYHRPDRGAVWILLT